MTKLFAACKHQVITTSQSIAGMDPAFEDTALKAQILTEMTNFTNVLATSYSHLAEFQALKKEALNIASNKSMASSQGYRVDIQSKAATLAASSPAVTESKRDIADIQREITAAQAGLDDAGIVQTGGENLTKDRLICKISKKLMVDPVRSVDCNHVYDRVAIQQLKSQLSLSYSR